MSKLTSDTIPFYDQGHGEVVVLLNGLSRTRDHWFGFDRRLATYCRVISIELRGAGLSAQPCTWQLRMEDFAADVIEVLDLLRIEKAHIFGVSLGGMVAMSMGIAHPHRCQSLTVVNSSLGGALGHGSRLSRKALHFFLRDALTRPSPEVFCQKLTDLVVGKDCGETLRRDISEEMSRLMRRQPPVLTRVIKQLLAAHRFQAEDELRGLQVPTLIVNGSHDAFVPPCNSERLARMIPRAEFVIIAGGGHELMYDKPDELLEAQLQWIRSLIVARVSGS